MSRKPRVPFVEIDGSPYRRWWSDRFAPDPDPLAAMRFYQRGRSNIWVGTAEIAGLEAARLDAVGVHLLRIGRRMWKPTSTAIRALGGTATINAIDLEEHELRAYLAGLEVEIGRGDARLAEVSRGFVEVRYLSAAVGCGEWHDRSALVSLLPASQRVSDIAL